MKRVLITGAGSFVGTNVARWLLRTPGEFEVDTVDTVDDAWKTADFTRYDAVFHVAGIAHVDPKPELRELYYRVNRDLAVRVARHARECGVGQFVFMSSKIVYHASKSLRGDVVRRDTEPRPNDFYGDSKLQAERGLRELETDAFRVCVLRPPMVYGPGNKGNLPRLGWLAVRVPVFPAWHNKRSMIHVDNLAEFVRQAVLRRLSGTFFPQNAEYSDTVELVRRFAREHGHRIWISRLFNPLVWLAARVSPAVPKMFADSYYEPEMSEYGFDYRVVGFAESLDGLDLRRTMR